MRFMRNHNHQLQMAFLCTFDMDRESWTTSANMKFYYDNLAAILLKFNFIILNSNYDSTVPINYEQLYNSVSHQYCWVEHKKNRCLSFDETHCSLNQSRESGRSNKDEIVVAIPEQGEKLNSQVIVNKSSVDFTMVGGSAVSGQGKLLYIYISNHFINSGII